MNLLECKYITKSYDNKNEVLKSIDLVIPKGKIIGLLGKNGAGKTTFIKLINGLLKLDYGDILFNGEHITFETKEKIAYLPERSYLDKTMKVFEVLNFFEEFYQSFDREKAEQLLKELKLDINKVINTMSKGMQEKLGIILVMSRKAELYILDEPLGGVDPSTRDYILDTIITNFEKGASVIISTHLISDVERILDEVIFLDEGKIILNSNADKLRKKEKASIDVIFRRMLK